MTNYREGEPARNVSNNIRDEESGSPPKEVLKSLRLHVGSMNFRVDYYFVDQKLDCGPISVVRQQLVVFHTDRKIPN